MVVGTARGLCGGSPKKKNQRFVRIFLSLWLIFCCGQFIAQSTEKHTEHTLHSIIAQRR